MKLHLPTRLRAAVMACLAAVASLSPTVATGVVGGGALILTLVGQQARATTVSPTYDAATKTITLTGSENEGITPNAVLAAGGENTSEYTLKLQMTGSNTHHNYFGTAGNSSFTFNMNLLIDGGSAPTSTGFIINNGNSNTDVTFTGDVTGNGLFSKSYRGWNGACQFTGDVSQFTGDINLSSDNDTKVGFLLRFGNGGTASCDAEHGVSGTGTITFNSTGTRTGEDTFGQRYSTQDVSPTGDLLVYNYSGTEDGSPVYVTNIIAKGNDAAVSRVTQSGAAAITYTKACNIDLLTVTAGSSTFNSALTCATATFSSGTSLTLNGASTINALTLNATGMTTDSSPLLTLGENATLTLTSLSVTGWATLDAGTYNLFSMSETQWEGISSLLNIEGLGYNTSTNTVQLSISLDGPLTVDGTTLDFAYDAATARGYNVLNGGTLTFDNGSGDAGAATAESSYNYGDISITGENSRVTLLLWRGTARTLNTDDKVTVASNITLAEGGTLRFEDGSYHLTGTVHVNGTGTIYSSWDKGYVLDALTSEAGATNVLNFQNNYNENASLYALFYLPNANASFTGTVNVTGNYESTHTYLVLGNENSLQNATVNLGSTGVSILSLNTATANIQALTGAGQVELCTLTGNAGVTSATLNIANATGSFSGTVAEAITLNIASGSQTLEGATVGSVNVTGGTLTFAGGTTTIQGNLVANSGPVSLGDTAASYDGAYSDGANGFKVGAYFAKVKANAIVTGLDTVTYNGAQTTVTRDSEGLRIAVEDDGIYYVNEGSYTYDGSNTSITNMATAAGTTLELTAVPTGTVTVHGTTDLILGVGMSITDKVTKASDSVVMNVTVTNGATVTQSNTSNPSFIQGVLTITDNGTYQAIGEDALGWGRGGSCPSAINIDNGGTLALGSDRHTFGSTLNLNGNASVTGAAGSSNIDTYGCSINATGTNNVISAELSVRDSVTINVAADSGLEISGKVYDRSNFNQAVTKAGEGTLTLSNTENNITGAYNNNAGTTIVSGGTTFNGALTIAAGSTMQLDAATTANGAITLNGALSIGDGGSLTMGENSSLTLNTTITGTGSAALTLAGTLSVGSLALLESEASDGTQNGFADNVVYTLAKGVTVTGYEGKQITVGGEQKNLSLSEDGALTFTMTGTSDLYWVRTDGVDYSADDADMTSATAFQVTSTGELTLAGGTVPAEGVVITNYGTVNLQGNTTGLARVTNTDSGTVYLTDTTGGQALAFTGVFGSGANLSFTANDDKTVSFTGGNKTFTGDIIIKSGYTLKAASSQMGVEYHDNQNRAIIIENGATYDIQDAGIHPYYKFVLQEGATLSRSVTGDMLLRERQLPVIELEGDATISSDSGGNMRMVGNGYSATTLALGSHTLTVSGGGAFTVANTAVTGTGTIDVQNDIFTLLTKASGTSSAAEATIHIGDSSTFAIDFDTDATAAADTSVYQVTGNGTLQIANGRTLVLGNDTAATTSHAGTIRVGSAEDNTATISLGAKATLDAPTTVENGTLSLAGSGTYNLGNTLAMTDKVTLSDNWAGTVTAADVTVSSQLDASGLTKGNSTLTVTNLTVSGSNTALTLAANTVLDGTLDLAHTITLAGTLTLGDNFMLDLSHLAASTETSDSGEETVVYTVFTGGNIDLSVILDKSQITGLDQDILDKLVINTNGTLSYVDTLPANILPVGEALTYGDDQNVATYDTIRLTADGSLTFADTGLNEAVKTLEVQGNGSIQSTGSVDTISVETLTVSAGKTLTLAEGDTDLTTKVTDTLTIGNGGAIKVENGQTLDVTELTEFTDTFVKIANGVSGAGTVQIKGCSSDDFTDITDPGRLVLHKVTGNLSTGVNIHVSDSMAINANNATNDTVTINSGLTIDNILRLESGTKVNVATDGSLSAQTIQLGHAEGGGRGGNYPGHLNLNGGSIRVGSIVTTVADLGDSTINMTGGTLELTAADAGIASTIATTISGGTLKAEANSWSITGGTVGGAAVGSVVISTTGDKAITLNNTTLTSTINTDGGQLVLSGAQKLSDSSGFQTTELGTSYHKADGTVATSGYMSSDIVYKLATNKNNLTVEDDTTWTVETTTRATTEGVYNAEDKTVTAYGSVGTEYYINGGETITYNSTNTEFTDATKLVLANGTLDLASDLGGELVGDGRGISVTGSGTTLNVGTDVTLAGSSLTVGTGASVTMTGSGTLTLTGNKALANLPSGMTMGTDATNGWTGTVLLTDSVAGISSAEFNNPTKLQNLGGAGGTVELYNVSGHIDVPSASADGFKYTTIATNLKLLSSSDKSTEQGADALTLSQGSSSSYITFSGDITGDGNFNLSWGSGSPFNIAFSGDVSGWTGDLKSTASVTGAQKFIFTDSATTVNADFIASNITYNRTLCFDNANQTVTMNGTVTTKTVEVTDNTTVNFTNTVNASALTAGDNASVSFGKALTAGTLTAGTGSSVTFNDTATLNTIAGGNVTIGTDGNLTLTNGASNVTSLTANGGLTLGDSAAGTTATLTATGVLTVGSDGMTLKGLSSYLGTVGSDAAMVTAGSLTLGQGVNSLNITADLEGLQTGNSLTLLTLTGNDAFTGDLNLNGSGSGTYSEGVYTYTLAWDGNDLVLSVVTSGISWDAPANEANEGNWNDASNWESNVIPGADDTALLGGGGVPNINVDGDETVGSLTVDKDNDTLDAGQTRYDEYTLVGSGSLSIQEDLQVIDGKLVVDISTAVGTDSAIQEDGHLVIGDGNADNGAGSLTIGTEDTAANLVNKGSLAVNSDGTLTVMGDLDSSTGTLEKNAGTLTVGGTLTLSDTQTALTNAGTLTAGALQGSATALTNEGSLELKGDSSLKSLTSSKGSSLTLTKADPDATAAPTLTLTEDSTLAGLAGEGTIDATGQELTLTKSTAAGGISLTAQDVVMETAATTGGVTLSGMTTDSITFNGLEADSDTTALTLTGNLAAATVGGQVLLTIGTEAADLATGTYKLLDTDNTLAGLVTVSEDYSQSLLREGKKGLLDIVIGAASYEVSNLTGEDMTWHTSTDTTEGGLKLKVTEDPAQTSVIDYNELKGVASIYVDADRTLSLEGKDPMEGFGALGVNNLQGDHTLTIEGDGIGQDFVDLSVSELTNGQGETYTTSFANGTLVLSGVTATAKAAAGDMLTQSIGTLKLEGSSLVSESTKLEIGQLEGDADSIISGVIHITGTPAEDADSPAAYTGSYGDGGETLGATVILDAGAEQTLTPGAGLALTTMAGSTAHLTEATQGKEMTSLAAGARSTVDLGTVAAGDAGLTVAQGGTVDGGLSFAMSAATPGVTAISGSNVTYGRGSSITITQTEGASLDGSVAMDIDTSRTTGIHLARVGAAADSAAGSVSVTLDGALFHKYYDNARLSGTDVVADRNTHYASDMMGADSHNGKAGASLLDDILVTLNPQADSASYADLSNLMDAVDRGQMSDTEAAAVAGASIATLGSAFSGDVDRQLRAIRNRTTTMGVDQCQVNEDMPYFNAWVNAEGDYRKMDEDGTAAGYTLSSWGGTVGFDVDITPSFTAGLAVTAMYGDLDSKGPDSAEGDFDTYYVSLFARYVSRSWTHTFVGTVGWLDASLDRTVSYAGGSYKATGDTEGVGFGLMYEVGYVIPLNEDNTACLQPVFNVAWRHIGVDGYSESGSDAGLRADDQGMDVVTFGLGARFQSAVAENIYNRSALFEARALLKVDAGDRQSDLDVALLHGTNSANIESAETGAVGVELGAGLTIPVGAEGGALFIDGSAELRDSYTNLNGTVGYRINF